MTIINCNHSPSLPPKGSIVILLDNCKLGKGKHFEEPLLDTGTETTLIPET